MLISFKPEVYRKIKNGTKFYEHRTVFPNEPILAYMYVSSPVKAITGILHLSNRTKLSDWKEKYADDTDAVKRIEEYMQHHNVVMQIDDFYETNAISLEKLREDLDKFVAPQMYYYLDNTPLLKYLKDNIKETGLHIHHDFDGITSNDVCRH
jgi:predicted transcriptional regulator